MKTLRTSVIIFVISLLASSCAREVFTQSIRERVESKQSSDIERLQYYTDARIVLTYSSTSKDNSIQAGKVEFVDGIYRYFVEIPRLTPCIARPYNENILKVYVEEGENSYLLFEKNDKTADVPGGHLKGRYQLALAREEDGNYVRFESKKFRVVEGEEALLLIDKNLRYEDNTDRRRVKGVRVE